MDRYVVTGMSCAVCAARVEKAVRSVNGVKECSVSLLANSMTVEGEAHPENIIKAVENAGYGASILPSSGNSASSLLEQEELLRDKETTHLKRRLLWSLGFLAVLMYISMGHGMFHLKLPEFIACSPLISGFVQMLLSAAVMIINRKFFTGGFRALLNLAPDMDSLVALGSGVSFVYSMFSLSGIYAAQSAGNEAAVKAAAHNLYFEGAAMIVALITLGRMLESVSRGRTTVAIKSLLNLSPKTAILVENGREISVPAEQIRPGDIFMVKPGGSIPADGMLIEGIASVDESMLTGESIPADKQPGDKVSAATINCSGYIKCRAERTGSETVIAQIIRMVSDAAATKAPAAKTADKIAGIFVPVVIILSVITAVVWLAAGQSMSFALSRAISVLVISCPCALGLATPAAIMTGSGAGASNGILFKNASVLEQAGKIKIVALDKTGTITKGEPETTDVIPYSAGKAGMDALLQTAFSLEQGSSHPLAKAVTEYCRVHKVPDTDMSGLKNFENFPGGGLRAETDGGNDRSFLYGGSIKFIRDYVDIPPEMLKRADELSKEGKTVMAFAEEAAYESAVTGEQGEKGRHQGQFLGIIAVADSIKPDSARAVRALKQMGIKVVMLTGDNENAARAVGRQAGVDEIIADILPGEKEAEIRRLKEQARCMKGKKFVAMAGDGINDAPALACADIGIAIGNGTDIAIEAAGIVLMNSSLAGVTDAIRLSRAVLCNIHQNLFWAFFYNAALIPVAAGVYYKVSGLVLNPMLAAMAMSLSSICVVMNALRLNMWKAESISAGNTERQTYGKAVSRRNTSGKKECEDLCMEKEKKTETEYTAEKNKEKEKNIMTEIYRVEGMMCAHCEMHVKKAVEAIEGVEEVSASHEKGEITVKSSVKIAPETIKKAVMEAGYNFIG